MEHALWKYKIPPSKQPNVCDIPGFIKYTVWKCITALNSWHFLWFLHQNCLDFTEIVGWIVFSLQIQLLCSMQSSTKSLTQASVGWRKVLHVSFGPYIPVFFSGFNWLELKRQFYCWEEDREESKSASLCNCFSPKFPNKKVRKYLSLFLLNSQP